MLDISKRNTRTMGELSGVVKRLLFFVLLFLSFEKNFADKCDFNIETLVSRRVALSEHTFWASKVSDEIECAKHCVKSRLCKSFNYDTESKRCELNDATLTNAAVPRDGLNVMYSDIALWPSQIDPDCYDRPCGDDEVCIPGQLTGGSNCSYTCFKLPYRCPMPEGTKSGRPRKVGSIFEFSCERGFVGGDTALCLPTGQWNKTIDTTCSPLYGSTCTVDTDCGPIDGSCINSACHCSDGYTYSSTLVLCVWECEPNWVLFEEKCYLFEMSEMQYPDAVSFCDAQIISDGRFQVLNDPHESSSCVESSTFRKSAGYGGIDVTHSFCGGHASRVVQVNSVAENDFLRKMMRGIQPSPATGYWNDLFEVTTNGNERWRTSNDSYDTQGWFWGEPNDFNGKESCTAFSIWGDYAWFDVSCTNDVRTDTENNGKYLNLRPVCEKDP